LMFPCAFFRTTATTTCTPNLECGSQPAAFAVPMIRQNLVYS
jgi:hypothetical protein